MTAGPVANPAPGRYTETRNNKEEGGDAEQVVIQVTWIAVSAKLVSLLVILGSWTREPATPGQRAGGGLCECLTAFGVLNNPRTKIT